MSVEKVQEALKQAGFQDRLQRLEQSSATVELAAQAIGTEPARIAKTLSFRVEGGCVLVVCAGDTKVDNRRFKQQFGVKATMLSREEVLPLTGHPVGGVCPFATSAPVYLDESLRRFDTVYPAGGSGNTMVQLSCEELEACAHAAGWVDVCKGWRPQEQQ